MIEPMMIATPTVRTPRAEHDPAEDVPAVPVQAEVVLRPILRAAEQMDARRVLPVGLGQALLDADRDVRVVGGDHRREDGGANEDREQDQPDLGGALAEDRPGRVAPQVARAAREDRWLPGRDQCAAGRDRLVGVDQAHAGLAGRSGPCRELVVVPGEAHSRRIRGSRNA
jgi:hypothetical protein